MKTQLLGIDRASTDWFHPVDREAGPKRLQIRQRSGQPRRTDFTLLSNEKKEKDKLQIISANAETTATVTTREGSDSIESYYHI